ncbi:PREDICTED: sodium-dependent nutrient amino acid transporter 1-like [Nicrophorus vespilloides]|uniref:Transporter n=1 Tax=Nicrophorus vespilloides TaxID=110193 RepID=A0ABM1M1Y9_NICVS|nr:PREDICTED: sodium-dependent nutrient amino acid transporter 1-like [Nicrophorus vespilloides]
MAIENRVEEKGIDNAAFTISFDDVNAETKNKNKQPERAQWGNGLEFLMSCIAMSVGLGNIWRFPFTAYENGGGAFLIPYIIVLVLIGRPVYYLEMCLGQFSSRGNVKMFEALAPALKGIGYGQSIGSICVATYYCSLMAITLFYFVNSFTGDLPWAECRDEWIAENVTCIASKETHDASELQNTASSSELFFKKEVLKEITDISGSLGLPEWRLTICLLVSWIATFLVSRNGVQSSGKASYFLALFPYVVMITLLARAATLEGAPEGMFYFIDPVWERLLEAKVWYSAVTQCFFSLNIGFGTVVMYSSYNDFNHNIYRDAIVVSFMDTFTSILAGTTIFGILGNLAQRQNMHVKDVVNAGGTGLAFISYPEAIAKFDSVPWLFAILFFMMLFILGVGSLIALQGSAFTIIMDNWPHLKKWHVSLGCGIVGFIIGLVFVTPGGQFIVTLLDYFGGTFIFFILTTMEVICVFWWYGLENFCDDIEFMLKRKVGLYWRISWGVITPVVLVVIFIYFVATLERLQHEGLDFPDHVLAFGWVILGVGLLQIIIWWSYYLIHKRKIGFKNALRQSLSHEKWGPKNPEYRAAWLERKKQLAERRLAANKPEWLRLLHVLIGKN